MNKKFIVTIMISFSMILLSAMSTSGIADVTNVNKKNIGSELLEKTQEETDQNITLPYFITTYGPISKFITKIEILDGPENQTAKIEKLINRRFMPFSRILPLYPILVTGLNFTVEYKINVRNSSRFGYVTMNATVVYNEGEEPNISNESYIYNTVHKIKVENFTGVFTFMRARIFKGLVGTHQFLNPARFLFIGFCENLTFLPVIK